MTQEEIEAIGKEVAKHLAIQTKRILTFSEAVEYTGGAKLLITVLRLHTYTS